MIVYNGMKKRGAVPSCCCMSTGREEGQLWYPRKVAVMRNSGKFVVCDRGNERSRMQIFTRNGHFLKKIAIRYIDIVAGLAITGSGEQLVGLQILRNCRYGGYVFFNCKYCDEDLVKGVELGVSLTP